MINRMFIFISLIIVAACSPPVAELSDINYAAELEVTCQPGSRLGEAGTINDEQSLRGIHFNVRTPKNYDSRYAHPLLVVYSPGDRGALGSERFTRLTTEATAAGFIVAYAENRPRGVPATYRPITTEWINELGSLPDLIAKKWCVDQNRIFLTGHSNGGTVSTALALLKESRGLAAAIAPSAAGFARENFAEFTCPKPLPVMIMHSKDDELFAGYGQQAAQWWRQCNACDLKAVTKENGCTEFQGCTNGARVQYCEGAGQHTAWPKRNKILLQFLSNVNNAKFNR